MCRPTPYRLWEGWDPLKATKILVGLKMATQLLCFGSDNYEFPSYVLSSPNPQHSHSLFLLLSFLLLKHYALMMPSSLKQIYSMVTISPYLKLRDLWNKKWPKRVTGGIMNRRKRRRRRMWDSISFRPNFFELQSIWASDYFCSWINCVLKNTLKMLSAICNHGYKSLVREGAVVLLFMEALGRTHALQTCGCHTGQPEF